MDLLTIVLFIFLFLLILVNLVWNIHYTIPKKPPVHRQVLHFRYNRDDFCSSIPLTLEGRKHCKNQVNSIAYGPIEWINGPKNLFGSIYTTTGSIQQSLFLENYWITFSNQDSVVIGALRWSSLYKNPYINQEDPSRTTAPYVISSVAASTGNFSNFNNGKILFDYRELLRHIYIFGNGYDFELKDYLHKNNLTSSL
jgi:hypothetical protein